MTRVGPTSYNSNPSEVAVTPHRRHTDRPTDANQNNEGRITSTIFLVRNLNGVYYVSNSNHKLPDSHVICSGLSLRQTKEGERIPLCQYPLKMETETCNSDNSLFLFWPTTVVHKIDSSSPLYDLTAKQLMTESFEIIVILEGKKTVPSLVN